MKRLARRMKGFILVALPAMLCAMSGLGAAAELSCGNSNTLEALVDCISLQMPQNDSNGYNAPNVAQRADLRNAVTRMLQGECAFALPSGIAGPMRLRSFQDASNGRDYCVLMETADANEDGFVDRGWGTFIVYRDATRELSHQAPHPKFDTDASGSAGDSYTEREAIRIFKQTDSRSYLMCGARRSANTAQSTCQSGYEAADCAHNTDNMFYAANEALNAFYAERNWTALQWHGMASGTCSETMFMSIGFDQNPPAESKVIALRDAIRAARPDWAVSTPNTACSLNATDNPTGRMLNGVPTAQSCGTVASAPSHKFMHIEQDVPVIGNDLDGVSIVWAGAIIESLTVPSAPESVNAAPGSGSVSLNWTASPYATRYIVQRSEQSGGPYVVVNDEVNATRYTDNAVTAENTYFYVVIASSVAGDSAASHEVSATPNAVVTPVAFNPTADAYVRSGTQAGSNYGSASALLVKGSGSGGIRQAYLKFDLRGFSSVSTAKLRLNVAQNTSGGSIKLDARAVENTAWLENSINWNNRPAMGSTLGSAATTGSTAYAWYEIDVTAYVQAQKALSRDYVSFGLASETTGSRWAKVRSRNAASRRPELMIVP